MQLYDFIVFILKAAVVIVVVLCILIGVIWPLIHNLKNQPHSRSIESPVRSRHSSPPLFIPDEEEVEIPTTAENATANNKDIVKMALDDPTKTTLLIRNWIQEKK